MTADAAVLVADGDMLRAVAAFTSGQRVLMAGQGEATMQVSGTLTLPNRVSSGRFEVEFTALTVTAPTLVQVVANRASVSRAGGVNLGSFVAESGENGGGMSMVNFAGQIWVNALSGGQMRVDAAGSSQWIGAIAPAWAEQSDVSGDVLMNLRVSKQGHYKVSLSTGGDWHVVRAVSGGLRVERMARAVSGRSEPGVVSVLGQKGRSALVADVTISGRALERSAHMGVYPAHGYAWPWGKWQPATVSGLGYVVDLTYRGAQSETFNLAVDGLPASWVVLSRNPLRFDKGSVGITSLFISPTLDALPAPGTVIPFTVTARSADNALTASAVASWTVPAAGIPALALYPYRRDVGATDVFTIPLLVGNNGLVTDSFALSGRVMRRFTETISLPATVTVEAGGVALAPARVAIRNYPLGMRQDILFRVGHLTVVANFWVHPEEVMPLFRWAYEHAGEECLGDLAERVYALAWEQSMYVLSGRREGLRAVRAAADRLPGVLGCFSGIGPITATQVVSVATGAVPTDTQPLVRGLEELSRQVKRALDYRAGVLITPALSAVRLGRMVTLPVVLEHRGRVSGTFTLTVTDTQGMTRTFQPVLGPGERFTHTVVFTPEVVGEYVVTASMAGPVAEVAAGATATVLAYERLMDVLAVRGKPEFVETGNSGSELSVDVVNYTPLAQEATIYLTMTAPGGGVYYTALVTETLMRGVTNIKLGEARFVNAAAGVYGVEVVLVEEGRRALGGVNAGTGIRVTSSSRPVMVPPGSVTVTTWITTERTVYGTGSTFEVGVPISGGVDMTLTLEAAQHSGPNPSAGVAVTVPAGIYDVVYITGAVRWHEGGAWYGQVEILDSSSNKHYMLGHGVNTAISGWHPFVNGSGGLATMEAAGRYHAGRFIRLRVTDTAVLRFYIYDLWLTGSSANVGQIVVRLVQVDHPDNTRKRRMEVAMHHATPRHGLDAIQWDLWSQQSTDANQLGTRNQNCNGCHIQTQGLSGLAALNAKLRPSPVDERMMEWLSLRLRSWQQPFGRVDGHPGYPLKRTSLAAWAWAEQLRMEMKLGRAPSVTVTNALTRAVNWAIPQLRVMNVWRTDHDHFPWPNANSRCGPGAFTFSPMTTYYIMAALRTAYDLTGNASHLSYLTDGAMTLATQVNWRDTCAGEGYPFLTAPTMLSLQEAVDVITDTAKVQVVRDAIARFEMHLRHTQQLTPTVTANDGGWRANNTTNGMSDPFVTAMALYALARQGVRSTDANLVRATEFLLAKQDRVGRWYSIYTSNPVLATTWVDFALPLVYEAIGSYSLDVIHDTPGEVDVVDESFNIAPRAVFSLGHGERREWFYNQPETMRYQVISYTSVLTGLRPGDVRPLTLGTLVSYTIESGSNRIVLPGSYVQAVKLVSVAPEVRRVGVGQTARYTVTLRNPLEQAVTYDVKVSGLWAYEADQEFSVEVEGNGQVERVVEVRVPEWMQPRQDALWVTVNDGQDSDVAQLEVVREVGVRVEPALQRAMAGEAVTYTAVVSDLTGAGSVVDVTGEVGSGRAVTLAARLSVPANGARVVTWVLSAPDALGMHNLKVRAHGSLDVPEAAAQLEVVAPTVGVALGNATVGAGMPAVLTSTAWQAAAMGLSGSLPGARMEVRAPAGWEVARAPTQLPAGRLVGHGDVVVVPPAGTLPGVYEVLMTAVMTGHPQITAQAVGRVTVLDRGVMVSVRPTTRTVSTGETFEFEVLVTNAGTVADQVVVSATGMLGRHTTLVWDSGDGAVAATNRVNLGPGQSARFVMAGQATDALAEGVYAAAVMASSLSRPEVQAMDYGWLVVKGQPQLRLTVTPTYQLVEVPSAEAWARVSNVGTAMASDVKLEVASEEGALAQVTGLRLMVAPQLEREQPVDIRLPRPGRYVVTVTAGAPGVEGYAVATATVEYAIAAALKAEGAETWPGQSTTLPYTVTNLGQRVMNNLAVRLSVPAGPWAVNGVSAQNGPLTLTLPAGPVAPGANRRSYQVLPYAPLPYGAELITMTTELLANGEIWQTEQAEIRVRAPDFRSSSLVVVGQQVFVHDMLTYTWRLRNTGDADAVGTRAVVTLPGDMRFEFQEVTAVTSGTVSWDGNSRRLVWQGDLPAGGEAVVTFVARASFGMPRSTLASPFEVTHVWRPDYRGAAQYDYPYRIFFMIVRKNAP
jgi:hypothetical protein